MEIRVIPVKGCGDTGPEFWSVVQLGADASTFPGAGCGVRHMDAGPCVDYLYILITSGNYGYIHL
jgi:hypothetical protein